MDDTQQEVELDLTVPYELGTKNQRFVNHLIDSAVYYGLVFAVFLVMGLVVGEGFLENEEDPQTILITYGVSFIVYIMYYTFMEFRFGKTVGKFLTKTKVVNEDGMPPSFKNCILRSLSRMVPFEPFSLLMDGQTAWHDRWPKTYVVQEQVVDL